MDRPRDVEGVRVLTRLSLRIDQFHFHSQSKHTFVYAKS
jgi:hypothetical protein